MKNTISRSFAIVLSVVFTLSLNGQTPNDSTNKSTVFKNKHGVTVTPEKGDFAIGIDATPFLDYLGNMLRISDDPNQAPSFGFTAQQPGMIYGKYMLTDRKALTAAFRIGFSRNTDKDGTGVNNEDTDKYISSAANIGLYAGIEHSPIVKSRVRGFFGYFGTVGITPYVGSSYAFPNLTVVGKYEYKSDDSFANTFVESGGVTYSLGVGGTVGVEYFVFPKLSLRGQFNLMLEYQYQTKRKYKPESGSEVIFDSGMSSISLDNAASGAIAALFYF
jgi:hypothetical protein